MKIELIAEAFNVFNRTQVTGVSAGIYSVDTTGTAAGAATIPELQQWR